MTIKKGDTATSQALTKTQGPKATVTGGEQDRYVKDPYASQTTDSKGAGVQGSKPNLGSTKKTKPKK